MHFLITLSSGTALGRNFCLAVWLRKIGFPLMRRLKKIIFWGAGGPPRVIRCQTTQLAPSVNVPRIRRRLGSSGERGRFKSVPTARRTEKKQGGPAGAARPPGINSP